MLVVWLTFRHPLLELQNWFSGGFESNDETEIEMMGIISHIDYVEMLKVDCLQKRIVLLPESKLGWRVSRESCSVST